MVEKIAMRSDAGQKDASGATALMRAVSGKHAYPKIVGLLAEKGGARGQDEFGNTALMRAVMARNDEAAELLLPWSDEEAVTKDGLSLLMVAAKAGSEKWTRHWIGEWGAKDNDGRSALAYAVIGENVECLEMMLRAGCDMHEKDRHGISAWEIVQKMSEDMREVSGAMMWAMMAHAARKEREIVDGAAGEAKSPSVRRKGI